MRDVKEPAVALINGHHCMSCSKYVWLCVLYICMVMRRIVAAPALSLYVYQECKAP